MNSHGACRREVAEALQECLEMLKQGSPIEACMMRYPGLGAELRPLLLAAQGARLVGLGLEPRPGMMEAVWARLLQPSPARRGLRLTFGWPGRRGVAGAEGSRRGGRLGPMMGAWACHLRALAAAGAAALALLVGGLGVSSAAASSVPGEALYPVKTTQERFLLLVAPSDEARASLYARLAGRRGWELERLAAIGRNGPAAQDAADLMADHARNAASLLGAPLPPQEDQQPGPPWWPGAPLPPHPRPTLQTPDGSPDLLRRSGREPRGLLVREMLYQEMLHQQALYNGLARQLPPDQREGFLMALERSQRALSRAFMALEAVSEEPGPP